MYRLQYTIIYDGPELTTNVLSDLAANAAVSLERSYPNDSPYQKPRVEYVVAEVHPVVGIFG